MIAGGRPPYAGWPPAPATASARAKAGHTRQLIAYTALSLGAYLAVNALVSLA